MWVPISINSIIIIINNINHSMLSLPQLSTISELIFIFLWALLQPQCLSIHGTRPTPLTYWPTTTQYRNSSTPIEIQFSTVTARPSPWCAYSHSLGVYAGPTISSPWRWESATELAKHSLPRNPLSGWIAWYWWAIPN